MDRNGYLKKLFFKQWTIGLARGDVSRVLESGLSELEFKWLGLESAGHFLADPFPLRTRQGLSIIYEDFNIDANYGNISLMNLDGNFNVTGKKVLLDTRKHMSFPFLFRENGKTYIIPESVRSNGVCCYEYNEDRQSLRFTGLISEMPLYDPALIMHNGKYWLFGSVFESRQVYKLYVFWADSLAGPYYGVKSNPVKTGLDATRAAGNFIISGGEIFRPSQNCANEYGESITVNRITRLDEEGFAEEPYINLRSDDRMRSENGIYNIHTLNVIDDIIVLDGMKWTFSLKEQWRNFRRNRRLLRESSLESKNGAR